MVKPAPGLVAHFKTLHAFTSPGALNPLVRLYRRTGYPHTAKVADAVIINSESLRRRSRPTSTSTRPSSGSSGGGRPPGLPAGDATEAADRLRRERGIEGPFILFVSSLWAYKNCDGLLRAFALARRDLPDHRLVVVGSAADAAYAASCRPSPRSSASRSTCCGWAGSPTTRPCRSTGRHRRSCTRPTTRPSACRSSRRWPAVAPSSRPTAARCPRRPVGRPCWPTPRTRPPSRRPSSRRAATRAEAARARTGSRGAVHLGRNRQGDPGGLP